MTPEGVEGTVLYAAKNSDEAVLGINRKGETCHISQSSGEREY